jgi:sporulation protein YlmC with PRC-barrel domain
MSSPAEGRVQMERDHTLDELAEARGRPVYSSDGEKIGQIEDIYYDVDSGEPEWIGIGTGFLRTKHVLVPATGASLSEDGYTVPFTKERVKDSPDIDDEEISMDTERALSEYYGLTYSEARSDTGLPEATGEAGALDAVTAAHRHQRWREGDVVERPTPVTTSEELRSEATVAGDDVGVDTERR